MSNLNPQIDSFTKRINETVPAVTDNLSPLSRKAKTTKSIASVASDILNKIQGSLNVFTSIKTGAFFSFSTIKSFDLTSFFEGPDQDLKGKINNVASSFDSVSKSFQSQNLNLENKNKSLLDKLDAQELNRFEATKIAKNGFVDPLNEIKGLSNRQIVEMNLDPKLKSKFELETALVANKNLIESALNQKPVSQSIANQDKLINLADGLINIKELEEIRSPYEIV
jgi:hypothetical protein